MRGLMEHDFAFGERFVNEAEFVLLEVAKPAMNKFRAPLRCRRCEVALLGDQHPKSSTDGVAGDARAIDSSADDEEIVSWIGSGHAGLSPAFPADSIAVPSSVSPMVPRCATIAAFLARPDKELS